MLFFAIHDAVKTFGGVGGEYVYTHIHTNTHTHPRFPFT